jgi:hypothetical protein
MPVASTTRVVKFTEVLMGMIVVSPLGGPEGSEPRFVEMRAV